jgi:hypothetical protein
MVSSIGSPCYALVNPFACKSESFLKNTGYFLVSLKFVNIQTSDSLVSFDVASLFNNIPVDEALQLNSDKLPNDDIPAKWPVLQVSHLELIEVCLRTTYFLVEAKFFQ